MTRFAIGMASTAGGTGWARPVVVVSDRVAPLLDLVPDAPVTGPAGLAGLLPEWDRWCDRLEAAADVDTDGWTPAGDVVFEVPWPAPPTIYACGANYYDHVAEMKGRVPDKSVDRVFHFLVPPAALVRDGADVHRPEGSTMLDYEVELVAVLGRGGAGIDESTALEHVAAYTVVNDVSMRDPAHQHPIFGANFLMAKGQATLKPLGPVLVPARFVPDPGSLALSMHVDGKPRQDGTTKTMIWSLAEQIASLSRMVPLQAGDLIMTGTPAGTSAAYGRYLADGEVMVAHVEGIGTLTNRLTG